MNSNNHSTSVIRYSTLAAAVCATLALATFAAVLAGAIWVPAKDPSVLVFWGLASRAGHVLLFLILTILAGILLVARFHWTRALPMFLVGVGLSLVCFLAVPGPYFGAPLLDHDCRWGTSAAEIICSSGAGISVYRDSGIPYLLWYHVGSYAK